MQDNLSPREQHFLLEMKNKALQIPKMKPMELTDELRFIRGEYEIGHVSMEVATKAGKPFVEAYNKHANERAVVHGLKPNKGIRSNVKFYPMPWGK